MKTPTHVEFESSDETVVMPVSDLGLRRYVDNGDKKEKWVAFPRSNLDWQWFISPETAARLRRELLGEGEAEAAPPPDSKPPVVTGPGVYRDGDGWGRRIVDRDDEGRWYAASPEGADGSHRWGDDGREVGGDFGNALKERVADLEAWTRPGTWMVYPAELAAMLAAPVPAADTVPPREGGVFQTRGKGLASSVRWDETAKVWRGVLPSGPIWWTDDGGCPIDPDADLVRDVSPVPAAEPEFVAVRLGMFAPNGIFTTTYPLADRELAERSCAYNGSGWSVVPLYIRREDARP